MTIAVLPPGSGPVQGAAHAVEVGGEGLEEPNLLVEGDEGGAFAVAEAVQEGAGRLPERHELRADHAVARVEGEHRVDPVPPPPGWLQGLEVTVVAHLEVRGAEAADRDAAPCDEDLDPDEIHFRPEDRRPLENGPGQ